MRRAGGALSVTSSSVERRLALLLSLSNAMVAVHMEYQPSVYLTQNDHDRLSALLEAKGERFEKLEGELARAVVVPSNEIPADVVTMNSRVLFANEVTGERREVILVFPFEADIDLGKISILAPVGTALLGLRKGQSIDWEVPSGEKHRYRVIDVLYQPENEGG